MSDYLLRVIPTRPEYVPNGSARQQAQRLLQTHVEPGCVVIVRITDETMFVDAGGNFQNITCSICGRRIADEWWSAAMDQAHQSHFSCLDVITPCCQSRTSLNSLTYNWPQGFARFILEAPNPGINSLNPKTICDLEKILECTLRIIWAHY
jgi:hypothetical protein